MSNVECRLTNDGIASGFVPRYRGTTTRQVAQWTLQLPTI
ncbi:hypothetical protein D1AOALGA4SA_818 [Olavius algarvensis Delta 1 endosymbiont]|nr:hypothetical protein D1AOALGA4SA_818 [Olavius algarvensis Delta 1 endosymbiont]